MRPEQLAFDPQIAKGPEIRAHRVAGVEERLELVLQSSDQSVVGDRPRGRHGRRSAVPNS